ncbi:hypothetical protein NDN08_001369 [Rhodosorus marinus]|uniref:S1-like domain-containing protein n=1 Tax=Rhodosorus marinus TaxID=101924 RepID=A0AAV8UQL1_9RHOD|nr:hypothetical protein NDN08_001369 [Rhodosorus marinus]
MKPAPVKRKKNREDALYSKPEPDGSEAVMRVKSAQGANLYMLEDTSADTELYELPKALRHVLLIRPGSYVIAGRYNSPTSKVVGEISHVLLKQQIDHLVQSGKWPDNFASVEDGSISTASKQLAEDEEQKTTIVEEESSDDLPENTNRRHWDVQESSSEDESDES